MAVGAYISVIATMKLGFPFPMAIIFGGIVAALAGLLVGIPSLRLKGDYLAIATLGFAEIIRIIFLNIDYVGGAAGMVVTSYVNLDLCFCWGCSLQLLCYRILRILVMDVACIAIREDEIAADAMGINTTYYKVVAFTIGSFFAGVAGAIYAHNFYIIQPTSFSFLKSFDILIFVVLGGLGSLSGSVISAIFLTIVSAYLENFPETRMIIYSVSFNSRYALSSNRINGNKRNTHYLSSVKEGGTMYE